MVGGFNSRGRKLNGSVAVLQFVAIPALFYVAIMSVDFLYMEASSPVS